MVRRSMMNIEEREKIENAIKITIKELELQLVDQNMNLNISMLKQKVLNDFMNGELDKYLGKYDESQANKENEFFSELEKQFLKIPV